MRKKKIQSDKSVDQKLDGLTTTVNGLATTVDAITITLSKMATKEDLDGLAKTVARTASTVDGLTQAVSGIIGSLSKMATKDELKGFATKDDLKSFATKDDLKKMEKRLETKFVTKDHFDRAVSLLVTKNEFDDLSSYVYGELITRKEVLNRFHDFQESMDEVKNVRDKRLIFEGQHVDLQNTVAKHENRIVVLEKRIA